MPGGIPVSTSLKPLPHLHVRVLWYETSENSKSFPHSKHRLILSRWTNRRHSFLRKPIGINLIRGDGGILTRRDRLSQSLSWSVPAVSGHQKDSQDSTKCGLTFPCRLQPHCFAGVVEVAGIEPASQDALEEASTCVSRLGVSPMGWVLALTPWLSPGDLMQWSRADPCTSPCLVTQTEAAMGELPRSTSLCVRQREQRPDGRSCHERCSWQMMHCPVFYEASEPPRHASFNRHDPVETCSPPLFLC